MATARKGTNAPLKSAYRRTAILVAATVFTLGIVIWLTRLPAEPSYGGKPLSVWLDEIQKLDFREQGRTNNLPVHAVRTIGTNAVPWLLSELRADGSKWHWRANELLNKQSWIKFRFADVNKRLSRATVGFRALGEAGAPAIPELLRLVNTKVGYAPGALACIGPLAVPALQQCLTNALQIPTSAGPMMPCPGNTIGALHNESLNFGHMPVSALKPLIPAILQIAEGTNQHARRYAANFLKAYDQKVVELATNEGARSH